MRLISYFLLRERPRSAYMRLSAMRLSESFINCFVFECAACRLKQKCMFCRPKSQQNASRFSPYNAFLHSTHTKTCKNRAFTHRRRAKTNNEALHYANCKMPAKVILQVFKMRLQNEKNCAICTGLARRTVKSITSES